MPAFFCHQAGRQNGSKGRKHWLRIPGDRLFVRKGNAVASDKNMREFRKVALAQSKGLVDELGHDGALIHGLTAEDLLRKVRNRIWAEHGQEELDALEAEIDLGM